MPSSILHPPSSFPLSPRTVTSSHPLRHPQNLWLISAGMLALLLLPALFSSCRSMTPLDVAARSLVATVATVDAAMTVYGEAVALGLVTPDDIAQVKKLYADYQAAETFAEIAITNAKLSGDVGGLASATDALTAVKLPLLQFLARFTTSPPGKSSANL